MKLKNYIYAKINFLFKIFIILKNKLIYYPLLVFILYLKKKSINKSNDKSLTILFSYKFRSKKLINQEQRFNETLEVKNKKVCNFFYDDHMLQNFQTLFQIITYQKITIILSSWGANMPPYNFFLVNLKKILPIKIFTIVYDSCHKDINRSFFNFSDHFIIADNPKKYFIPKKFVSKSMDLNPIALNVPVKFHDINTRNYIFNFIGQTNSYRSDREIYIDNLKKNFINYFISTKSSFSQDISNDDYYNIISKSLITLNFSNSVHSHQLKARIWEGILSGSLILESRNDQSSLYFNENREIIFFDNINDLIDKIKYFNSNRNEAKEIALNAQKKAIDILNIQSKNFYEIYQ